jgi:hypothetical protein
MVCFFLQAAVYQLKEVSHEHQQKINKLVEANCTRYYQKGEQIFFREMESVMEDRLMSIKRASDLPKEFVDEAMNEYTQAVEKQADKVIQQQDAVSSGVRGDGSSGSVSSNGNISGDSSNANNKPEAVQAALAVQAAMAMRAALVEGRR